jgi:hypothetical protein
VNRRYPLTASLLAVVGLALCAGLAGLYVELFVGFETEPMAPLPPDADVSSIMSAHAYAQSFVDEWKPGLDLTAVYGHYREDGRAGLVPSGEITYVFVGAREDWLAPIARLMGVHVLEATVVLDVDRRMTTYFRPSHTDRSLWLRLHPDQWGVSEDDLLQVVEDQGGAVFRGDHGDVDIVLEADGRYWGDMWRETYYSGDGCLSIVIDLRSGEILKTEGDTCDYVASSWQTVGFIAR